MPVIRVLVINRTEIEKLMWDRETKDDIGDLFVRRQIKQREGRREEGERWLFFPFILVFWRPLPMLRYVTTILNNDGASSNSVVSHLAVTLTGKSGFRLHARCAMPRTGASRTIINCTCARALWAAELRKFGNCRRLNVYRGTECKIFMLYMYTWCKSVW